MKVIYRGPATQLVVNDGKLVLTKNGPPVELSQAVYKALSQRRNIRLEVVKPARKPRQPRRRNTAGSTG